MMLLRTYLDRSPIHGIGVFAAEGILAGAPVWRFHPAVDRMLPAAFLDELPEPVREEILRHGYVADGAICLCADNARHINHSEQPNVHVGAENEVDYALRDIEAGEELTEDYRRFRRGACNEFLFANG